MGQQLLKLSPVSHSCSEENSHIQHMCVYFMFSIMGG